MALSTPFWRPVDWAPGEVPDGAGGTTTAADPTELIRGSDGVSTDSPQLAAEALALFPVFDANTLIASRPVGYGATPDPAAFSTWHSAHQMAWMAEYGATTFTPDGFTFRQATLGNRAGDPMHNLNLVLSADGARIIALNHLQPTDVAKLPPADQRAITLHPAWVDVVADRLNLRPRAGETAETVRAEAIGLVNALVARIQAARGLSAAESAAQLAAFKDPLSSLSKAALWPQAFVVQLEILATNLGSMAAFDMDALGLALKDLQDRFDRVQRFDTVTAEQDTTNILTPRYVNAVGGLATILQGRDTLVRVELKICDLARLADEIARTGVYEGRPLDTPALTFVLQTFANYRAEAEAEAKTEELNQRNALMKDYARMQGYLNDTLSEFDASKLSDPDQREYKTILEPSDDTAGFWRTVAMFDSSLAGGANSMHPSEQGTGVERPLADYLSGTEQPKEFFDRMAIELSEANKRLGQDNQLMMSNISQLNREKNRHYDMATNTLNKMTGLLRSITDSGSGE